MEIEKSNEVKAYIQDLWKKFLISEVCADIMLSEVADHLYVENVPNSLGGMPGDPEDPVVEYAVAAGFSDSIKSAIYQLYAEKKATRPYSELTREYEPDALMDDVFQEIVRHTCRYKDCVVLSNPYYRHIHSHQAQSGPIKLSTRDYLPYEFFQTYNPICEKENPFFYARIGFFEKLVRFPVILERDTVWMSIVLSEIQSMEKDIETAHGRVITYGLGLGYFAYMASRKKTVETVTVVELNPRVIEIFRKNILPQFEEPEKIKIIQGDAYNFVRAQIDGDYDFAYADFWAGVNDGVGLYLRLLPLTKHFKKTVFSYWIESCFIEYFFRPVVMKYLMKKGINHSVKFSKNPSLLQNTLDRFENFLLKREGMLTSKEDIDMFLSHENMRGLVHDFSRQDIADGM